MIERVDTFDDGKQAIIRDFPGVFDARVVPDAAKIVSSSTDPAEIAAAQEALTNQAGTVDNTSS